MVLHFEHWQTQPIQLTSVLLTDQNIYEVARWIGAGKVEIFEIIGKPKRVRFYAERDEERVKESDRWVYRVEAYVGNYIMRKPEHFNEWSQLTEDAYFPIEQKDIHKYEPVRKE